MKNCWLSILLFALGCGNEDPAPEDVSETVKVTIDGQAVVAREVICTLTRPLDEQLTLTSLFELSGETVKFILAIGSQNTTEELKAGEYTIRGTSDGSSGVYFYYFPEENEPSFTAKQLGEAVAGVVTLSEIDREKRRVSGTFHVKAARNGEVVTFTDGSFTRIPFTQ